MDSAQSLSHTKWECKYHIVWIPKCRQKVLYGKLRYHLGELLRDLYVVKEWLGHSTIQVTEKYAHLNPKKLHEAVSSLSKGNEAEQNITNEIVLDNCCILE